MALDTLATVKIAHDDLWQLIHSLSASEKRYFTLSARDRDSRSMILFDLLEGQKEYDQEAVKELFRENGFTEQVHVAKHYLYHLILKSLRSYHARSTASYRLRETLYDAELLASKGLYDQAHKTLNRAKVLAKDAGKSYAYLEILSLQRHYLTFRKDPRKTHEVESLLDELFEEEQQLIADLPVLSRVLYTHCVIACNDIPIIDPENRERLVRKIPAEKMFAGVEKLSTYGMKVRAYNAQLLHKHAFGDLDQFDQLCTELVGLIESQPRKTPKVIFDHCIVLDQMVRRQFMNNDLRGAEEVLEKLHVSLAELSKEPVFRDRYPRLYIDHVVYGCVMQAWRGEFERAAAAIEHLNQDLETDLSYFAEHLNLKAMKSLSAIAIFVLFGAKRYDEALTWITTVLNTENPRIESQTYALARFMQVMVHYELENMELVDYLARSTQRLFLKSPDQFGVDLIMLRYIRQLPGIADAEDRREIFRLLRSELMANNIGEYTSLGLYTFEYDAWAQSKIEGVEYGEVVRRRFREREESAAHRVPS